MQSVGEKEKAVIYLQVLVRLLHITTHTVIKFTEINLIKMNIMY